MSSKSKTGLNGKANLGLDGINRKIIYNIYIEMEKIKNVFRIKSIWLALSVVFALAATSCGGDDKDEPSPEGPGEGFDTGLVGEWQYTACGNKPLTYILCFNSDSSLKETIKQAGKTIEQRSGGIGSYFFDGKNLTIDAEFLTAKDYGTEYKVSNITAEKADFSTDLKHQTVLYFARFAGASENDKPGIDSRLLYTWRYTEAGVEYRLKFAVNGKVTETVSTGFDTWSVTGDFSFSDNQLILPEDFSFCNAWGNKFEVVSLNGYLVIQNSQSIEEDVELEFYCVRD